MLIVIGQSAGNYFAAQKKNILYYTFMNKMNKKNQKPFYYCAPVAEGNITNVPGEILQHVKKINETYSKSKDFPKYMRDLAELFELEKPISTTESKLFFGGFVEGEASLNVSAKRLETAKFGLLVDPEFSVTQHINGISHLYAALSIFQTGRIRYKAGSNATFVFIIDNRVSLEEKVIPFYENYVVPYASPIKVERMQTFKELLLIFKEKEHLDLGYFLNKVLPLWDSLRMQKGQSNETFECLEKAQDYVRSFILSKSSKLA